MASHPALCGGRGSTNELCTAGEEVGTAGDGIGGGTWREVVVVGDTGDEVGGPNGAAEAVVFIPSLLPPRPLPPVPDGRRRVLPTGSIDAGSPPLKTSAAQNYLSLLYRKSCYMGRERRGGGEDGGNHGREREGLGTRRERLQPRAPGARDQWDETFLLNAGFMRFPMSWKPSSLVSWG